MALQTGKIREVPVSLSTHGKTPGGTRKPELLAVYPKEHPPLPVVLQTWSPNQKSSTTCEPDRKANISGPTQMSWGRSSRVEPSQGGDGARDANAHSSLRSTFFANGFSGLQPIWGDTCQLLCPGCSRYSPQKDGHPVESQHCTTGPEHRLWTTALNHLTCTCLSIPTSGKTCEHRPPP